MSRPFTFVVDPTVEDVASTDIDIHAWSGSGVGLGSGVGMGTGVNDPVSTTVMFFIPFWSRLKFGS